MSPPQLSPKGGRFKNYRVLFEIQLSGHLNQLFKNGYYLYLERKDE